MSDRDQSCASCVYGELTIDPAVSLVRKLDDEEVPYAQPCSCST